MSTWFSTGVIRYDKIAAPKMKIIKKAYRFAGQAVPICGTKCGQDEVKEAGNYS
jgi:hypothetical protein